MNGTQWIVFILIIQIIHFLGTWKLYVKAGRKAWEAAIPIYNAIILMKIIKRPKWWVFLLFLPIINLLMFPVVWVETIRSFGKNSLLDTWLVILTLGLYIYYINYTQDVQYNKERDLNPKSALGEWVSSIIFAIVAATFVHTYFIQPYVIPTGSLEKTLLVGDFLFVSKFHYGARLPMTTLAAPMVHDTIPGLGIRSYIADVDPTTAEKSWLNKLQLPYMRLPAITKVDRNDIVVFSWPADTVVRFFKRAKGVQKPIDKKSNYVKRCVGLPGDSLAIKNGDIYVNGNKFVFSERAKRQTSYVVTTQGQIDNSVISLLGRENFAGNVISIAKNTLSKDRADELLDRMQLNKIKEDSTRIYYMGGFINDKVKAYLDGKEETNMILFNMTGDEANNYTGKAGIISVEKFTFTRPDTRVFPQSAAHPGTEDNFGPIYIPQKGVTVPLNLRVLPYYKKIIKDYENNTISVSGNQISINGQVADTYTFKQNYYWMMGDNHHRSEDSKFWGYVPENHIVGTPIFIWMSVENLVAGEGDIKVRWDRVFTTVNGDGEPVSYFKYFLILLAAYFVGNYFWKKKKAKSRI
ncbi:signal peptidase I [Costertonia aggregata]|uniref:Signal peptidase I n=1 Tax=Costertonia aggregata TaxID=343403 RepID=A0A7H9AL52_9FLAO|nr:signal peptidase I [Costertonia aggregata]QLG44083.1 signal peptidase I [Costertonia aggregata]